VLAWVSGIAAVVFGIDLVATILFAVFS